MKLWAALSNATAGWMMILRGEADWRERFALTAPGLATALIIFAFVAFLAIALASTAVGMPDLFGVIDALLVHGIWVTALFVTIRVTALIVKTAPPTLDLLLPGIYLLIGYLLAGSVINLIFPPAVMAMTIALAFPLYRLARMGSPWTVGVSVSFAAATILLLEAVPRTLYMLSTQAGSPL